MISSSGKKRLAIRKAGAESTSNQLRRIPAENSNTPRHLAEFWMIEPEVAFNDINDNMDLAEEFIKYCVQWALDNCYDDVKFLNDMFDKGLIERLQGVLKESFVRLPYTEGIKILEEAVANGHKFEFPVYWGVDLASEHERYLVEEHFKRPVILTDYPKEIKAFYMKQNEDGKTVRAMDVLFPKIGEIIGGSEREENYDKLLARIQELGIPITICMLLYIWIRFRDVRFALSAIIPLIHDVLVVLMVYAVMRISVGNTFIACMLTIVGYSVNSTIVIFDRIRENKSTMKADLSEIVNASISQTLTRSINTSLTSFVTILVLFIMGVTSIREFTLPLMAGIVCGAYSSVCIAGAIWYVMKKGFKKKNR